MGNKNTLLDIGTIEFFEILIHGKNISFSNCAEKKAGKDTSKPAEDPCQSMRAIDRVRRAIDEQDDGIAEDLGNAVVDDHLVHPVLLLLHDDYHRPGVQGEGEEKDGKSQPVIEDPRDLRIIPVCISKLLSDPSGADLTLAFSSFSFFCAIFLKRI